MNEASPVQDWWRAIDGRWYPPASVLSTPPARAPRHARVDREIPASTLQESPFGTVSPGDMAVPAPHTGTQSKRPARRPPRYWILAVLLVLIAGSVSAAAIVHARASYSALSKHTVTYSVTGSGTSAVSSITYRALQGGNGLRDMVQVTDATVPWTSRVVTSDLGLGTSFSVRVENGPTVLSYVTCSISEDGLLLSTDKAEGPHAVASCSSSGSWGHG